MRWEQTEFLLKGIYLGLLLMVALQGPDWAKVAKVGAITFGVLAVSLAAAAWHKVREGYRPRGRPFGFLLFLLLENPGMVYTGLVAGLALGAYTTFKKSKGNDWSDAAAFLGPVFAGVLLGVVFYCLRNIRDRKLRMWLCLALAAILSGAVFYLLQENPKFFGDKETFGLLLLLGIPGFYLLTFASMVEESEVEIAAICATLGAAFLLLNSSQFSAIGLAIPLVIYFLYTRRILPGLRVFKHTLRGLSYSKVGQYRPALVSLNRALQLDPQYSLAREQLWQLHRQMDIDVIKKDQDILSHVNYDLCLERVAWLLLLEKPKPEQIHEAQRLLELVAGQKPALEPRCAYWRAVAFLHQRNYDQAAADLESVLRQTEQDTPQRRSVLFQAWQLAALLHAEMNKRVATPLLAKPGRRLEAIAAVERQLAQKPDDQAAWTLKRVLYAPLTEADYGAGLLSEQSALDFDHAYAQQLGLALVDDGERWQRGCEFLRIAARGLATQAPAIYILLAKTCEKHGDQEGLWANYQRALQLARKAGIANLKEDDRKAVFDVAKLLGEHKMAQGDIDAALDAFKFFSQNERAGLETYRTLAELFERMAGKCAADKEKQDNIWQALNCTEHALTYNGTDKDLIERKDRYYYSITPEDLKSRLEQVHKWFDAEYCLQKARWVLDRYSGNLDLLDWGSHLADLAQTAQPGRILAKLLRARIRRLRGDIADAAALLEEIRQNKPEKFASVEEEDSWFLAHRFLGDMYLDEKPDQAVQCFHVFRTSQRAGADTMYKLGRAYENLGDHARAAKCYEHVTAFEDHPLIYEAREGLERVRRGGSPVS